MNLVAELGSFEGSKPQLAQLIYDQVTTFPETHDQGGWGYVDDVCGTVACVSGWAQLFSYGQLSSNFLDSGSSERLGAKLLGLNRFDAHWLFYGVTEEQARHALKFLANGEPIDWAAVGHRFSRMSHGDMVGYIQAQAGICHAA